MPGKSKEGGGLESSPVYKKSPMKYGKGSVKHIKNGKPSSNMSIIEKVRAGKHKF